MTFKRVKRAARFASAAVEHASKGFPKCSQEQVDERFAICNQCDELQEDQCGVCECYVGREVKFLNKLAWADQTCPLLKWKNVDGE